jgi:uncharacterized protein (DUF924 family)
MTQPDEILSFWFPPDLVGAGEPRFIEQVKFWFRGGADEEIVRRFPEVTVYALDGGLVDWEGDPRSRLALVLALDQFPRSLYRDSPRAFAGAPRAERLCLTTLDAGDHGAMLPWEQMFFGVPLGHSEDLALHDRAVPLAESLAALYPPELRKIGEVAASQARAQRDEIARFGRHPSRNPILGRVTTPEEQQYLDTEGPAYLRSKNTFA